MIKAPGKPEKKLGGENMDGGSSCQSRPYTRLRAGKAFSCQRGTSVFCALL